MAEQTAVLVAVVDIQAGDGMPIAVKCARVGKVFLSCILSNADWRPRFVFQINVCCQHDTDFGFI